MQTHCTQKKVVLTIAGHDPSGAAGIQADMESIAAAGCQCISLITVLTIQNTSRFDRMIPQQPEDFIQQYKSLSSDIKFDACKIGLIGDLAVAEAVSEIVTDLEQVPVVLDPVLHAGTGTPLATRQLIEFVKTKLLPNINVLTPNCLEARQLTGTEDTYAAGQKLLESGCPYVLITGADEPTTQVTNILFHAGDEPIPYEWERLPGAFHGSGCTLSSTIASNLANGAEPASAIAAAQEYTWQALKHGYRLGLSQIHPDRFHDW